MQREILRYWVLWFIFVMGLFAQNSTPLKIEKYYSDSTPNDISICARVDRYFGATDAKAAKPYVKIVPNQYFKLRLSYDVICIGGLKPQTEYSVTIDKNIPLGSLKLDKRYDFKQKTDDYMPSFNFTDSGYILPAKGDISIPIETLNVNKLSVSLYRINQNNLMGIINRYGLFRAISRYSLENVKKRDGYMLWKKKLPIESKKNISKTTAIPVGKYLKKLKPGVYILGATTFDKEGMEKEYETVTQWFMVSDIGLYTLEGDKGLHIYTKRISDASKYKKVKLQLVSKNNEVLGTVVTKNGYGFFNKALLKGKWGLAPKAIYAYGDNGDFTVLDLSHPALDLTDRGVAGRKAPEYYDGFIYSNRDIFRPGKSVPYTLLLRDSLGHVVSGVKLSLKLLDSRGVEVDKKAVTTDKLGAVSGVFKTSKNAETGRWSIVAYAGNNEPVAKLGFLVEDFVPPKIEVLVQKKPKELKPNTKAVVKAKVKYLTGDVFPNAEGEFKVILHKAKIPFKAYAGYQFGKINDSFSNDYVQEEQFTGDENGSVILPVNLDTVAKTSLPVSAYVKISVNEPGGRPVERGFNIFFNDKYGYIGIKPNFDYDAVDLNVKPSFNLVYIRNGKPVNMKLHYRVIAEEVEWNWQYSDDRWEYYQTYSDDSEIQKGNFETNTHPSAFTLDKLDWGTYRLEVSDEKGIISSYRFNVGYEVGSSKASPDRLPIATDKKVYAPNDTVKINMTPKFSGPVLVNIANSRIVESKEVMAKEGVPLKLEFKIKKEWASSTYVLATAFRAQNKKLGASRAVGVAHIEIKDPKRVIDVKIDAPKKIKSDSKLKVILHSKKALKESVYVTLAAVDKGVLNITKYSTPKPEQFFWGQKKLAIEIRDIYADLIKAVGEHAEFEVGAGDVMEMGLHKEVTSNKRKVISFMSKPVSFNKNGKAVIDFDIPNFQGSLKLMAVVWSKNGVGSSDSVVIVKDPISLEAYMPRFLANGDTAQIMLSAMFDKDSVSKGEYSFKIQTTGGIEIDRKVLKFSYDGIHNFMQSLFIKAKSIEDGKIAVSVLKNGKTVAKRDFELAVRSPYPQNYIRRAGILNKDASITVNTLIDAARWQSINNLRLTVLGSPLVPLNSIEKELKDYCCRCAEQTTSRAFPYLSDKTSYAKERIEGAIERLKSLQKINGSFGLWYGSKESTWVSAYVLDFLTRAKLQGYKVAEKNINEGLKWLQNSLYRWSNDNQKQEADAYALYVLARNSKILMSDILFHVNNPKTLITSGFAWGHLAASLALLGEKEKATEVFKRAVKGLGNVGYYANYGGVLRDKAALIVLMKEAKTTVKMAESLFVDLALDLKDRKYLSTQEMSQIIRATKIMDIKPVKLNLMLGNKNYNSKKPFVMQSKTLLGLPDISNHSSTSVWYNLGFVGTPKASSYNESDNRGFSISKNFYDMYGNKLDTTQIAKNTRVVVVISGKIEDRAIDRPMIMDFLPSGFEIENPDISGIDEISALNWIKNISATEKRGYRDDRFTAALKIDATSTFKVAYIARAVTLGRYALPPVLIEDMYKPRYRAFSKFDTEKLAIKKSSEIVLQKPIPDTNVTKTNVPVVLTSRDYRKLMNSKAGNFDKYTIVQLNHLRNGIFAQAGLDFSKDNPALYKLFSKFDWYKPTTSSGKTVYSKLTALQEANVLALLKEEKRRCGGNLVLSDFYRVSVKQLNKKYLKRYSKKDLRILRNSLIARYGLLINDKKLTQIFSYMPWYKPNPEITASEIIDKKMSDLQRANIQTILKVEKE